MFADTCSISKLVMIVSNYMSWEMVLGNRLVLCSQTLYQSQRGKGSGQLTLSKVVQLPPANWAEKNIREDIRVADSVG